MAENAARPVAMDPPHITEFASERYFEKLKQSRAQQQQQQQHAQATLHHHHQPSSADVNIDHASSPFILPLRDYKAHEVESVKPVDQKRDKSRFLSIRSKVSFLHSKSSHVDSDTIVVPQIRPSVESTRKSQPFDKLFLALPSELQIQIISSLPLQDVLNLRLASKSWHSLITLNETTIVRYHIDHHIPAYALRLYPISEPGGYNFHHLCGLWHRLHVAAKLSSLITERTTKEIFLRHTEAQRQAFASQQECMRRRLIPILFTIFHFFETYRKLHLQHLVENPGYPLKRDPYTINPIELQIMNMYDDRTLLRVHEAFPLVISSFHRRLRPPTYVGRVERSFRGYIREKPSDDVYAAILLIGGLREVERLWEIKGYNTRRAAVDTFMHNLTKTSGPEASTKQRRGLMSFGRKKSTSGDVEMHGTADAMRRSSFGSVKSNQMHADDSNWVFNTSLAAGAPMSPLSHDHAKAILADLPILQQIWTSSAEALVVQRKIVKPQDIKRSQQMMLDLIREDALNEEDEWWYGRNNPDSVRPPPAIDDDL